MKATGIFLILFSSFAVALLTVHKETLHCKHLDEMIRYLEYIKIQAMHYSDSLISIVSKKQSNDIAKQFVVMCNEGIEPTEAWKDAVFHTDLILTVHEKECIVNFGADICASTVESINENADRNINRLKNMQNNILADKERKVKLSTVLTVSCGLLIVLIFI